MHAIIRQNNGEHYLSTVFGYFWYRLTPEERKKYKADEKVLPWLWCRIVWDPEKKRLIKLADIERRIIIIDADQSDWDKTEYGMGCVDFLSKELLDSFLDAEVQPPEILEKCREVDAGFIFNEKPEVKTQKDIEDLKRASNGFYHARIIEEKLRQDGTLYLRFDGIEGREIEVWFWGDLEYDISRRNPKIYNPCWYHSSVFFEDGFVWLVEDLDMSVDQITEADCYFRARHMKYRVIPK